MHTGDPHHIIAIGASAGGLEEINTFFDHTPLDGVAYIIIQHLSADFKSRMVELLSRHSKLNVVQAEENIPVRSNHVYLIPSDTFMTISRGSLHLTEKGDLPGPHLTIDTFFTSLAAAGGKKAIGIILSGLGSDGTRGVKALKQAGGMIMIQNPETSSYRSMPSSALATGMVDFVLEPEHMPAAIEDYIKYTSYLSVEHAEDEKNISAILALIREKLPLDFTDYKQTTIIRRTKRRATHQNCTSLKSYLDFLKANPEELDALSKEFLISVTAFFRDEEAFHVIREKVLPDILDQLKPGEELKFWIAGCATGEEVYSLAILLAEQDSDRLKNTVIKLFATDIDHHALAFAGNGIYPAEAVSNLSAERLANYFLKVNGGFQVIPAIRKMIIFAKHDLVKNPPYCNMHFISCRNLLIYMTPVLQKKIFTMFLFGLRPGGYLFIGSSENPLPIMQSLEVVDKKWKIYKSLETKRAASFDAFSLPDLRETRPSSPFVRKEHVKTSIFELDVILQAGIAQQLNYLAVCVDENLDVIKSYGDTTKYLLQKNFAANLMDLLPKSLIVAFKSLHGKVLGTNKKASAGGIVLKSGDETVVLTLTIAPIELPSGNRKLLLVTLSEDKTGANPAYAGVYDEELFHNHYTKNLEREVIALKSKLQGVYEQLDASNENMQSFNEELLSANEEMQSTNEEMQSVNEELQTLNSEYQAKNKEILEVNDDLNNYFRSNINGQLFIDRELRLMKFSPGTVKQINLLEADIGRPLSDITTNIKFETLISDIGEVLDRGKVITKEIETNDGKWYQVMTMPYIKQSDTQNTGAIVTFNDISELKRIQGELDFSSKMLTMALDAAAMGTWNIDILQKRFSPSPRLKELFGFLPDEEMTYEAALGQIDPEHLPLVTGAINSCIENGDRYEVEYRLRTRHTDEIRWVKASGNRTSDREGRPVYFSGVMSDSTVQKQDEIRKNDFIAIVSHELRTPLTIIKAYLQLSMSKIRQSAYESLVPTLEKAAVQVTKMATLIEGFLDVSSFATGKIHLDRQTFDISVLVHEIVDDVQLTRPNSPIVQSVCDAVAVRADRDKIGQVINNLLSNAVKYSPAGTAIQVRCSIQDEQLQVSVKDEGSGIKPEDQKKLFDRYFRIDNPQTQKISGFGLGLYLSSEIINAHKGTIWLESEVGVGSTFFFRLPLLV